MDGPPAERETPFAVELSTGVLPFLTTCLAARTAAAGLALITRLEKIRNMGHLWTSRRCRPKSNVAS